MRVRLATFLAAAFLLAGCNSYNLLYCADPQPKGAFIFADYMPLQSAVGVSVDTDGRRLQEIYIKKEDGTVVHPLNISYPAFAQSAAIGSGVGVGTGNGGFGTGLAFPIGGDHAAGLTMATFSTADIGSKPWELHIKVEGIEECVVPALGGPPTAK